MSKLNEIYEQQYLKSIGKDDISKKRKREEALEYFDNWIDEQYERSDAKRIYNIGRCKHYDMCNKIRQEEYKKGECKDDTIEDRIKREVPPVEAVCDEYLETHYAPRMPLGLILSIRDLLD